MTIFTQVNPERFIDQATHQPRKGRGAWNGKGKANNSWRYEYIDTLPKIGTNAEQSLDAWATCAGSYGWQLVLMTRGHLRQLDPSEFGIFGPATQTAVRAWQRVTDDVDSGMPLDDDGTIGRVDAKALLTPIIDAAEDKYDIPFHYLRGETNLESALDTGALGEAIFYGTDLRYGGVDRSTSQVNSRANGQVTWQQAFNPYFSIPWSAERMRDYHDQFKRAYPNATTLTLWDAALCAHNSPLSAWSWARNGQPPNETAATYVRYCKAARYG